MEALWLFLSTLSFYLRLIHCYRGNPLFAARVRLVSFFFAVTLLLWGALSVHFLRQLTQVQFFKFELDLCYFIPSQYMGCLLYTVFRSHSLLL